jgi:hypothetical protein
LLVLELGYDSQSASFVQSCSDRQVLLIQFGDAVVDDAFSLGTITICAVLVLLPAQTAQLQLLQQQSIDPDTKYHQ